MRLAPAARRHPASPIARRASRPAGRAAHARPGPAACGRAYPPEEHRDPLPTADTERHEAELMIAALHLVEDLRGERGAGRADRMAERDRAAVGVDLRLVEAELVDHGERLGGERLVELDHADLVKRPAGALEHLADRRHGADAHDRGVDAARRVGEDLRAHGGAELGRPRGAHQEHGGAGVVHPGGVARGHGPVLLEHRLQLRHPLGRGVLPDVLVPREVDGVALDLDRHRNDLVVEAALGPGGGGPAVGLDRERVLALTGDPVLLGEVLGGDAHEDRVERIGEAAHHGVDELRLPHPGAPARARHPVRAAAHRLGPAGERHRCLSGLDRLAGGDDRLHAGAAQAVDGVGRNLLRDAGLHPDDPAHVHVARLGVDDVAEDDVVDPLGLHAGALEGRGRGRSAEVARGHACEALAVRADCGASGRSDNDVGHSCPFRRLARKRC